MKALFVAVDGGARETLAPIAAQCGAALEDAAPAAAESDDCWHGRLASQQAGLLVVGTSDSPRGRTIESAARRAARSLRIPVAAIEDFPGNYVEVSGGEASVVLVESSAARVLCLGRLRGRAPRVEVVSPARYDRHRAQLDNARRATGERWLGQQPTRVLWAGQPETDDALRTLEALLPLLRHRAVELVFKAHPRDPGYGAGAYAALLDSAGMNVVDATSETVDGAFRLAPRLVITQFSSIAIDAGFFGVPSLWVLLPGAGGTRLRHKKGYAVPPLCLAGGAACATDTSSLAPALAAALEDAVERESLIRCFDDYYRVRELGAARTAALLLEISNAK